MKNRLAAVVWWFGVIAALLIVCVSLLSIVFKRLSNNEIFEVASIGMAGIAAGGVCFAVCFVLSGSFWMPPKLVDENSSKTIDD